MNKNFVKNLELEKFFFQLKPASDASSISLMLEYENSKRYFVYAIEISLKEIVLEMLCESFPREGRLDVIYKRIGRDIQYGDGIIVDAPIQDATKTLLKKNPSSSLMALNREFPIIQDQRCFIATSWFESRLEVIGVHSVIPTLIDLLRKNKQIMEFTKRLVPKLSTGVKDVTVTDEDFDNWAQHHIRLANSLPDGLDKVKTLSLNANNQPILSIQAENGIKKVYQLMFEHLGKDDFAGYLETSSQSDGTLRALTLLPALYFASNKNKTVVIDEINCCLSPNMVKGIVEYFAKKTDANGQLIFTTHDNLLQEEKDILRSDEVWFVDKRDGASFMYSHNDFKEHNSISMMRGYKEGRFGAIRFVNLIDDDGTES